MSEARAYSDRTVYRKTLWECRRYWPHIAVLLLLSLLIIPLALLTPVPLKIAVDNVIGDEPLPGWFAALVPARAETSKNALLAFDVAFLVVVALLARATVMARSMLRTYTVERLTLHFRARLFRHAQRLALSYHDREGTADANYRIQSDAAAAPSVAVDGVIPFFSASVMLVAMLVVIARIDSTLALIALAVAPVLMLLTWSYRRRLRARYDDVKVLESSALAVVQESLTALRVVKAFNQEQREERRFEERARQGMWARVWVMFVDNVFWLAVGLVLALGTAAVLYVGVRGVLAGTLTLGSLLLVMAYLSDLFDPLEAMSRQVAELQSGFASAQRIWAFLGEERDVPERPDAVPLRRASGAVEFRDVGYAYEPARPVLEHVSFAIEPGTRVGIAGRTGAGKTTLVSLLTRFFDPTSGAILLDGVDLRDYRLDDLRNQFAIVLQEPVLFSTTIGDNIAYGRPEAGVEEIVAAARAAGVHDFVAALPNGYDTEVGERGMSLSGGERQRISLARAFLKDAPILILDEPTSAVDVKTERLIMETMERLMADRTTFMIAHRLSTLEICDARLELSDAGVRISWKTAEPTQERREAGVNEVAG